MISLQLHPMAFVFIISIKGVCLWFQLVDIYVGIFFWLDLPYRNAVIFGYAIYLSPLDQIPLILQEQNIPFQFLILLVMHKLWNLH